MSKWTADFTNDPFNDYELIIEIQQDDKDLAIMRQGINGLELKWYASNQDIIIPINWLIGLINEANKNIKTK